MPNANSCRFQRRSLFKYFAMRVTLPMSPKQGAYIDMGAALAANCSSGRSMPRKLQRRVLAGHVLSAVGVVACIVALLRLDPPRPALGCLTPERLYPCPRWVAQHRVWTTHRHRSLLRARPSAPSSTRGLPESLPYAMVRIRLRRQVF